MAISNSQTLISLLLSHAAIALFVIILAMANTAQSQTMDFYTHGQPLGDLILQGDAHYLSESDSTYTIRLTKTDASGNAVKNSVGRVVFDRLVPFWREGKQASFETTIKFIITPNGANSDKVFADGIAFFIGPVGTKIPDGSAGGNFGIFGPNGTSDNVFALEFDTYVNEWDPNFRHIGIDLESRNSVAVKKIPDSLIGKEVTLQVNYEESTHVISAVVTAANSERHEVSFVKDLKGILDQDVQFGIAASTGEFVAIHDVVSWSFHSTPLTDDHANGENYIRQFV